MAKNEVKVSAPVVRTSAGLRDAIFDEIDAIRSGASNPTRANAVAKLANGIVETVHMEIEVHKYLRSGNGTQPKVGTDLLGGPISLGAS